MPIVANAEDSAVAAAYGLIAIAEEPIVANAEDPAVPAAKGLFATAEGPIVADAEDPVMIVAESQILAAAERPVVVAAEGPVFWAPNSTCPSARCHFTGPKKLENSRAQTPPTSPHNGYARIQNIMHGAV